MMRLPRFLPSVVIACASVALPVFGPDVAFAQDQGTGVSATAPKALKESADAFWHYAKTYRYDLANAEAKKIIDAKNEPVAVLKAFQAVSEDRKDNLDQWLLRWQQVPELRDSVDGLLAIIRQGHGQLRADASVIDQNIKHLIEGEQAYAISVARLRDSGELAISPMIDYLRDPSKKQYEPAIRRAFVEMGKSGLAPLVAAATYMPADEANQSALLTVISALGEIQYDVSIPPLAYLANNADVPAGVKQAARQALSRMVSGDAASLNTAQLYFEIAQKYYYGKAATSPEVKGSVAYLWSWDNAKGLVKKDIPAAIYGDVMTLRAAKRSLQLNPGREEVLALWLTADYSREADLPAGMQDPTAEAGAPSAHYYGVLAGAKTLNAVLTRALGDQNTPVALAAVKSLQRIGGQSNLFTGGQSGALVAAMQYPDRVVRFEAAFAAAAALPQTSFEGQERVAPILAEAVAQTGKPFVLVVAPEEKLNARVQDLKDQGYLAFGATTAEGAAAIELPAVDAIVISDDSAADVEKLRSLAASTPRLSGAAFIVTTQTAASPFAVQAATNPLMTVTQAAKGEDLKNAVEQGRKKAGSLPMDEKVAADYALTATDLLGKLAGSRGQVLDVSVAQVSLLQALSDSRQDVSLAAGKAVAMLSSKTAQQALLVKATDSKTDDKTKVAFYGNLATSAKFFGNQLDSDQVQTLQGAVSNEASVEVRSAAAEAHGALNLPADQIKSLLVK